MASVAPTQPPSQPPSQPRTTAVGVFATREAAEAAIRDLHQHRFEAAQIGFAIRDHAAAGAATSAGSADTTGPAIDDEETAGGAATGALTGGLLGGIIAVAAVLLIPGVGPVVAGGVLASVLGGAAIGAAAGGLLGALVGMGVPEDEARFYATEFHAGSAVVTVRANGRYDEALSILRRHGAYAAPAADSRAGAMTGAVQAETEDTEVALAGIQEVPATPASATRVPPPGVPTSRGIVPRRAEVPPATSK